MRRKNIQIIITGRMLFELAPITIESLTRSEPDLGPDFAVNAKHLSILAFESG